MIIRTYVSPTRVKEVKTETTIVEEVKPVVNTTKKKNKKTNNNIPVVEETVITEETIKEDIEPSIDWFNDGNIEE